MLLQRARMEGQVAVGFVLSPRLYTELIQEIGWFEYDSLLTWENLPVIRDYSFKDGHLKINTVGSEITEQGFGAWAADIV